MLRANQNTLLTTLTMFLSLTSKTVMFKIINNLGNTNILSCFVPSNCKFKDNASEIYVSDDH